MYDCIENNIAGLFLEEGLSKTRKTQKKANEYMQILKINTIDNIGTENRKLKLKEAKGEKKEKEEILSIKKLAPLHFAESIGANRTSTRKILKKCQLCEMIMLHVIICKERKL